MSRTFAYCRVSTSEQATENQIIAIRQAGYDVLDNRVVSEVVSGGVQAMKRKAFADMVNHKLESGDRLIVLKLDRLGRDNIDVQQTIDMLVKRGIEVVSLDLPVRNLTSAEGKLMLQMFSAFAEFEKSRIIERTKEGLDRAKQEGKRLGRPVATDTRERVQRAKAKGLSQSKAALELGVSLPTIKRNWNIVAE
ncbi:recombinase family protein [Salmonella enterica subsp. enterica serovar Java]|jgi:DNA invertase Pin-like site-specific DNA recombinase|uniref:Recombinase family protein n=7 Tax=Salmonella enterica I TaxID=59201 RepID=A0A3Z3G4Q4_SALEB|nr:MULTISPECIES: recombinase family protein [Enterobacteriaceae]AZT06472.1 recombinase family protein [Salmonella enterica subsp. enterica serovar 43:a:1,7]EAA7936038.1 recombinase family protein [Salmonella enterica subsp. enterica serovar Teko]EAB9801828.1 recombinase family protein [Salmonella enterica subsp. enterica serovar Adelaide]EAN4734748.1 recombinase family protein [Salmonella enterica subsp. enterica serovar Soerenga]EAO1505517.1 recombinase family protein [Salmonella enterica sub